MEAREDIEENGVVDENGNSREEMAKQKAEEERL